jgi:hypothetical protein
MFKFLGAAVIGGVLFITSLTGASAAPDQDGLVNVAVGDVTVLQDVNVGVAAQVVAQICAVQVGPVAILAEQVNATGLQQTVCTAEGAPVIIRQNVPEPGRQGHPGAARQNGLINVALGDVTILQNVNVGVAAQVIANICNVQVGPIAALANQLNAGEERTVCTANGQPVIISQS